MEQIFGVIKLMWLWTQSLTEWFNTLPFFFDFRRTLATISLQKTLALFDKIQPKKEEIQFSQRKSQNEFFKSEAERRPRKVSA